MNRVKKLAAMIGASCREHRAETGTDYYTLRRGRREFILRVASHGQCYGGCDASVDPDGVTWKQAKAMIFKRFGVRNDTHARKMALRFLALYDAFQDLAWRKIAPQLYYRADHKRADFLRILKIGG